MSAIAGTATPIPESVLERPSIYIGGAWVKSAGSGKIDVIDASTEEVMGNTPNCAVADVDLAARAAFDAFPAWSVTSPAHRADLIEQVADAIAARADEFTAVMAREIGMPFSVAQGNQTNLAITDLRTTVSVLRDFEWNETIAKVVVTREAVGVVGAITPWNYPLHQVCAKVGAALAAGCTVVLKPSEVAPLSAFMLADIIHSLDFPAGVFNLVSGPGPVIGEAIATSPLIDMVSFTGSTRAGGRVMALASQTIKRVALELGGKSANVLLDDADFEQAVVRGVDDCFRNSGQNCSALTRMIVPRSELEHVERIARDRALTYIAGDLFDDATTLGALANDTQRTRVRGYIDSGVAEGARLVIGGADSPEEAERGYFVRPTIFSDVTTDMTIAREEIFGPVLCILPYDNETDALRIANDSLYGLSGGVWSADDARAERIARRMRTGRVSINGGTYNPFAPFGGYKQSGLGRELGRFGLEEFLEYKAIIR
jgi:acyl-CoA reductase-like NAD-dependent aldehyde dehydrogenase